MARSMSRKWEGGTCLLVAVLAAHLACGHAFGTPGPAFVASTGRWMALSSPGRLQGTPFSVARGVGTARLGLAPHGSRLDPLLYSRMRSISAGPLLANGGGVIGARMIEAGDVSGWDVERVASWLDSEGFSEEWTGSFRDNEIDGFALSLLKDPDQLDAMGIPKPMGSRLKFWQKLDVLLSSATGGSAAAVEAEAPIAAVAAAASSAAPPTAPSPSPSSSSSFSSSSSSTVNELYSAPPREASPSPPPPAAPGFDLYSAPERAATPQAEAPAVPAAASVAQMDVATSEQQVTPPPTQGPQTPQSPRTHTLRKPHDMIQTTQVDKFMAGTETLVREAASVAGAALPVPVSAENIEALVADEVAFIDNMCQLLADLDAKDREVTLLLDLKSNLQNLFSVVVVGEFNAGKSSLINALLGSKFCKEGVVPTTATINMLRYGEGEETGKSMRNKDYVELFLPVPLLKQVTIVDTPGTNAIIKEQTRLTKGFIPQSDLILFVTSAERPLTETEGKLMEYITTWGKKVVMVLNKVDLFQGNEGDRDTVTEFVRENAEKILGTSPPVFAVAGREALKAKLGRSEGSVSEAEAEAMWKVSFLGPWTWWSGHTCII
jgi:small GTP-binding protein